MACVSYSNFGLILKKPPFLAELFKLLFPPWYRGTCLKSGHAVLGGLRAAPDVRYFRKKFSGAKGKRSPGAGMLPHSVRVFSAAMGLGGGKLWGLLKNRQLPNNIFTGRDEIGFKNNGLKIIEEGTGSHWD